ncbi:thioredoxin family protein [Streptomyces telluris]|uniref:Thioredoxin family protein n=1 Tax=Streptomyces telluris TaxID=2720021 RepID=A0A9X2LJ52_9ACTN|nr:thioredoxin family protein [Streptomyces telluris]MCQ8771894.1 thioredoxin family protein [Streptomyces telluris]NJP80042.1 thioredoxin family protein [Streptomyces telluris]
MAITPLTSLAEFEETISQDKPVVVFFCATWASLCRVTGPLLERFSDLPEFAGTEFRSVDLDEAYEVAQKAGVGPVPVVMAFRSGTRLAEVVAPGPEALRELISAAGTADTA